MRREGSKAGERRERKADEASRDRSSGDERESARVSLMITQAQKARLRELGYDDDEIAHMTPAEAHRLLGLT